MLQALKLPVALAIVEMFKALPVALVLVIGTSKIRPLQLERATRSEHYYYM